MKTVTVLMAACSMAVGVLAVAGCEKKATNSPPPKSAAGAPANTTASLLPAGFFLASAPADAKPVEAVKPAAKVGDTVTISGRVGGSRKPFVDGRAVFTLMGPELKACSDIEGDGCKYPWDYCCEKPEDIAAHSATVQVVDAAGAPLRMNLQGENGLKELSKVTVVGKVVQVEGPNVVINATGMHVN
jgi:hypothetical protein